MYFLKKKLKNCKILLTTLIVGVVFYNELLIYYIYKYDWPTVDCGEVKDFYKILFVADPQILGENTESWIARWDSDRFLQRTFLMVFRYVNPTLVIFLGDLMDEGSVATSAQYKRYQERFNHIFYLDSFLLNKTLFLPGDNDIGGEDEEVTPLKLNRFDKVFGLSPEVVRHGNIDFLKVNRILRRIPKLKESFNNKTVRICLSHIPLLGMPDYISQQAIKSLQPNFIFSAHDHKSVHLVGDLDTGEVTIVEALINNPQHSNSKSAWRFQASDKYTNEIVVPTSSYRMGVPDIGYGFGLIDKKGGAVCYGILWLPQRIDNLLVYLYVVPLLLFISACLSLTHGYKCLLSMRRKIQFSRMQL